MKNLAYMASFHARRLLPERAKVVLRLVKLAVTPYPPSAPIVPQALLNDCQFISDRDAMLFHLPKEGVVAEVGTLYGDFSRRILDVCAPKELHLFDLDFETLRGDVADAPNVRKHRGMSAELLGEFPDNHFDWIYIDGDHTYEGVKADIQAAMNKIKPGGYMVFNDFARIVPTGFGTFGVHQAVCEFAVKENWPFAYFCFQSNALYDAALKKPSA